MPRTTVRIASLMTCHAKAEDWADQVLSLLDPHYKSFLKFETPEKHLVIRFEDLDWEAPKEKYPREDDIRKALEFVDDSKKLVIHCHAGLCRSTALALGVLVRRGLSFEEAIDRVREESPDAWPNMLVVRHIDAILTLEGKLVSFMEEWQTRTEKPSWLKPSWHRY